MTDLIPKVLRSVLLTLLSGEDKRNLKGDGVVRVQFLCSLHNITTKNVDRTGDLKASLIEILTRKLIRLRSVTLLYAVSIDEKLH
jgi:hypothetical protein